MSKYNRKILLALSDSHAGNELGLLNPETVLQRDEGDEPVQLNESQAYLWGVYTSAVEKAQQLAEKDEIIVIHMGDVCQGHYYVSEQVSNRVADDINIAIRNFDPICALPNVRMIRIAKGTGVHNCGLGSSEIMVASFLSAKHPVIDTKPMYHGLCTLPSKFIVDFAHHGPVTGKRNWLKGNDARLSLRSIMMDEIQQGNIPAKLYLRGHRHDKVIEQIWLYFCNERYESMLAVVPPLCLLNDFGIMATQSSFLATTGMLAFEILNDRIYDVHELTSTLDIRVKETISETYSCS